MKTTCLVFMLISCAALMRATSNTAPDNPASQQSSSESATNTGRALPRESGHAAAADDGNQPMDGKASDEPRDQGHSSENNRPRPRIGAEKANQPNQPLNSRERSRYGNEMNVDGPALRQSGSAAKEGLVRDEALDNSALPTRPPSVVPRRGQSPNNVSHRGPNPAVMDGLANSNTRNTGAINGTRMNRRP